MPRHSSAGFTLIEVLVAVVILAFAALVLANAFGSSAIGFSRMQERTAAWLLASDKLVELQVYQKWPGVGTSDDQKEVDGVKWRIRTKISNGPYPDTRRVDIQVGPEPDMGRDFYVTYTQSSLLGKPFSNGQSSGTGTGTGGGTGSGSGGGAGTGAN